MRTSKWTPEKETLLIQLFPSRPNTFIAEALGVSKTTIKARARKLGLKKHHEKKWLKKAEEVASLFEDHSYADIAQMLGTSKTSVHRICSALGLKRTPEEKSATISSKRNKLIKRERTRMVFGFDPISRIKIVTNRPRIRLRHRLRSLGYIIERCSNIVYFSDDVDRRLILEDNGRRLGLKFIPLATVSSDTITV